MLLKSVRPLPRRRLDLLHLHSIDSRQRRTAVQPFHEGFDGRRCTRHMHEHRSVGQVLGATPKAERGGTLGGAGAEPDALDAPADTRAARRLG